MPPRGQVLAPESGDKSPHSKNQPPTLDFQTRSLVRKIAAPMPRKRLDVLKTYKLFIGGKFPRGESGRCLAAKSLDGKTPLANYCRASRKDFRDAVVAARGAFAGWAKQSAYLRGQILYRAAEMLQQRSAELAAELQRAGSRGAKREVALAIDRLVYHAGWTDKYAQIFGTVNPVATSHFNFTTPEPTGVVAIICPDELALLGLVSLLAPVILSGNTAVLLASETVPLPAITFAEILATSDLPGGVVNILTGLREELVPQFASHMDVNAIVDAGPDAELSRAAQAGTAINLKRYARRELASLEWFSQKAEDPYWILDTVEFKTAWHPIGI
jgi:acyl-CoA reductase-like NAD-dependent aldehyde dehydrogenase